MEFFTSSFLRNAAEEISDEKDGFQDQPTVNTL